jgi:hypothetical protein
MVMLNGPSTFPARDESYPTAALMSAGGTEHAKVLDQLYTAIARRRRA